MSVFQDDNFRLIYKGVRGTTAGMAIERMFNGTTVTYENAEEAVGAAEKFEDLANTILNHCDTRVVFGVLLVLDLKQATVHWEKVLKGQEKA